MKRFEESENKDLFYKKVLFIDSNMESVVSGWSDDIENDLPDEIRKSDECKKFLMDVRFVKTQSTKKSSEFNPYLPDVEESLRNRTEPRFRKLISEYLKTEFSTVEQRIHAIQTNRRWKWVGKLYPAVFTRKKQVIFMSMDKLLARNTTIVEPSYLFYNSDLIKNAVIIIDEFDATKDIMLKNIIQSSFHHKINYIELFKDIYAALCTDEFPLILTTPSKERQEIMKENPHIRTLESIIESLKQIADQLYKDYSLQFKHRTLGEKENTYQNFLFQDYKFHSILNADNTYVTMDTDADQKINSIQFSKKKPKKKKNDIPNMLGQLRGFLSYFQGTVHILSINYMQCKRERRKSGEDDFSMESAVRSVLSLFRLSSENIDYFTTQIMMIPRKTKHEMGKNTLDLSFYEKGFRYFAFENDDRHDMQSQIMMYSFQTTPEKILLKFCEKAKVIGISATATIPSVVGNYDLEYLQVKLQNNFIQTTLQEKQRLIDDFNKQQAGYQNIKIQADLLGERGEYSLQSWLEVFNDMELAKYVFEQIQHLFGPDDDKKDFLKKRYLRIALAFKQFVIHEDIHSFLCMLNKHPKPGDKKLDQNILFDIFKYIAMENNFDKYDAERAVVFLTGSEYSDKKVKLIERLGNGEKIFVISVYQTIGVGQNLQYSVPKLLENEIVKINDRNLGNDKDFDAIYLDKPTNLIVPLNNKPEEDTFVKFLFQMEYLQEAAELSPSETMEKIKNAFKIFMGENGYYGNGISQKKSVMLMYTRLIIQAIGRICRTNQKNKNIYIYADYDIADILDVSVVNGRAFNPEFIALINKVKKAGEKTPEVVSLEDKASLISVRSNRYFTSLLSNPWTTQSMEVWKQMRRTCLINPVASREIAKTDSFIRNTYIQLPSENNHYFYCQKEDYSEVSVSFVRDKKHSMMVSEAGTKLQEMLRIPGVKEYFEKKGYATSFENKEYMMSPPLWNNIYKGALGEVVGKFVLEEYLNIPLNEIENPEIFEMFDYQIEGTSIFVDFKNWHEGKTAATKTMINKIRKKAKQCGCKCAIIINIIAERKWKKLDVVKDDIRIVTLACLGRNSDGKIYFDKESQDILRRCYDEYKN